MEPTPPVTIVDPYAEQPFMTLQPQVVLRHVFGDGSRVDISFDDTGISISDSSLSGRRLLIEPVVSNAIKVRSVPR